MTICHYYRPILSDTFLPRIKIRAAPHSDTQFIQVTLCCCTNDQIVSISCLDKIQKQILQEHLPSMFSHVTGMRKISKIMGARLTAQDQVTNRSETRSIMI